MPRSLSCLNCDGYSFSASPSAADRGTVWTRSDNARSTELSQVQGGGMTSVLISWVVRVSLLILAPWLVFSNKEKQTHEAEISHQAESPRGYPGELELLRQELGRPIATWWTECWTNTKDVLNVFWLSAGIQIRSVQSKISDCFQTKPEMEIQTVDSKDFGLEERKMLKGRAGMSPAVDALLHHSLPASSRVKQVVPDSSLLQFAALTDDLVAQKIISELGGVYQLGGTHALFGHAEKNGFMRQPWERRLNKRKPGMSFSLERKYMRSGLYLYRSVAVFEYAKVEDFCRFILNSAERREWDWSTLDISHLQTESEAAQLPLDSECSFIYSESKMPGPLSNREYVAARRVWRRRDGGCYSIMTSAPHPMAPPRKGRNVRVEDYTSAFVLRPLQNVNGLKMHGVEMTSLYYDNAKMRPMAYNLAMNASMWTGIVTTDNGFRQYQERIYSTPSSDGTQEAFHPDRHVPVFPEETMIAQKGSGRVLNFVLGKAIWLLPVVFVVGRLRGCDSRRGCKA